ncbi:MAG: DUF4143 domain-containing protein [Myxococcota bacterium]
MVFSEIEKTRTNFLLDWSLSTWRTKDQSEIDFVVSTSTRTWLIEAKLGIHRAQGFELDREAKKVFGDNVQKVVVNVEPGVDLLTKNTLRVGIWDLGRWMLSETKKAPRPG